MFNDLRSSSVLVSSFQRCDSICQLSELQRSQVTSHVSLICTSDLNKDSLPRCTGDFPSATTEGLLVNFRPTFFPFSTQSAVTCCFSEQQKITQIRKRSPRRTLKQQESFHCLLSEACTAELPPASCRDHFNATDPEV